MLALGTKAPGFRLPNVDGKMVSLEDFAGSRALLVVFMCNHCPYVKHVLPRFVELARDLQSRGTAVVGISANDAGAYPADAPGRMAEVARSAGFSFPYLYDESQDAAKAYRAACTPDFFLFDAGRRLVYRGQMDDSRPGKRQARNREGPAGGGERHPGGGPGEHGAKAQPGLQHQVETGPRAGLLPLDHGRGSGPAQPAAAFLRPGPGQRRGRHGRAGGRHRRFPPGSLAGLVDPAGGGHGGRPGRRQRPGRPADEAHRPAPGVPPGQRSWPCWPPASERWPWSGRVSPCCARARR